MFNKFIRKAEQLGSLKHDVRSLGDALKEARRDNSSMAEELQAKSKENKFLTGILREKVSEMKKALSDWLDLNKPIRIYVLSYLESDLSWRQRRNTPEKFSRKLSMIVHYA